MSDLSDLKQLTAQAREKDKAASYNSNSSNSANHLCPPLEVRLSWTDYLEKESSSARGCASTQEGKRLFDNKSYQAMCANNSNNKNNSSMMGGATKNTNDSLSGRVKTWFFSTSMNDQSGGYGGKPGMGSGGGLGMGGGGGGAGPLGGGSGGGPLGSGRGTSTDLRGMNVWMPQTL